MASNIASKRPHLVVAVVVSVLILQGITAVRDLDFTQEPSDTVVLRSRPLTLGCAVTGLPPLTVQWLFNGQAISPNEDRQVLNTSSLLLPSVLPKRDSGEYQCCVSNKVGRICSCPATVTVANVPRYSIVSRPDVVQTGGVLRLECSSEGPVPVSDVIWRLGKDVVSADHRRTILPNGVLQVTEVSADDAGNYRCLTENIADRRIKSPVFSILVLEPASPDAEGREPVIVAQPQLQQIQEGGTALFECLADGDSLQVTWSREDGQPIRTQDANYLGGSNLQLLKVTLEDEAEYVCTVENTATSLAVQARARLVVVVAPTFRVTPDEFFGPLGSTVRFSCDARGNPTPTIHWLHNGNPVELNSRLVQQPSDDFLFIGVRREDMGMVQCVAENEGGSIQAGAKLGVRIVDGPPDPPQNIRLVSINFNMVMVTWTPPVHRGSGIVAYTVHYKAIGSDRELQEILGEDQTNTFIGDLTPYTNYSFYMHTWMKEAPSDESKHYYIVTEQSNPSVAPDFTVASNTPTTITLNWQPVPLVHRHGVVTLYRIAVREIGEASTDTLVDDMSLAEFTLEGLLAGRIYQVRMAAATSVGFGVNSAWVTVQTRVVGDSRPQAPHFKMLRLNFTTLSIQPAPLQPSEMNLLGLKLFYSVDSGGLGETTDPILLPLNTTEYVITGLEPDTTYVIRLLAYTVFGDGHDTIQDITTGSVPGIPNQYLEAPTNLGVQALSSRSVRMTWQAPLTKQLVTGYIVRYWPRGNRSQTVLPIELDPENNNTINEVIVHGLDPFTMFEFDVCSVGTKVAGPFCDARGVRTLEDRPSTPPEDILAKPLDPHAVELQWQPPMEPNGIITHYVILYDVNASKPEDKWNQQARNGTAHHSTVDGLASATRYYFKVRAGTQVGEGPPTSAVAAQTLTADQSEMNSRPWQEGMLIGVCSAFVLSVILVFFIICKKRGILKTTSSTNSAGHVGINGSAVCAGCTASGSPDGRLYVMGQAEGNEQNGFTPMISVLPQPKNMDTKGGTPLIINGNGPVRNHHHHHHHYPNGGVVIPSRFPRSSGLCGADPDASSLALLPGSESVTNSDLGEENSQGKSEASSSSCSFSPYSQDPNHRTTAVQQCCKSTKLPQCSSCCLGPCPQLSDSSTGSYGEPVIPGSRVNRMLPASSPPLPPPPLTQSQGHCATHTGVNISCSDGDCPVVGGYYSDGRSPPPRLPRNELTWPKHTGRVIDRNPDGGSCRERSSVWEKRMPSREESPCEQTTLVSGNGAFRVGQSGPSSSGEDTSPDFLAKVLDEFGSCSTAV